MFWLNWIGYIICIEILIKAYPMRRKIKSFNSSRDISIGDIIVTRLMFFYVQTSGLQDDILQDLQI